MNTKRKGAGWLRSAAILGCWALIAVLLLPAMLGTSMSGLSIRLIGALEGAVNRLEAA